MLPSKVKVQGRTTLLLIGLYPAMKGKRTTFTKKNHSEKMFIILSWFVSEDTILKLKNIIQERDIECCPEAVHCGAIDKYIDLYIIHPFFR